MNTSYFYHDKPIFGLDIGFKSVKVMQIENTPKRQRILGYGFTSFPAEAIKEGVIVEHEKIAKPILELFKKDLVGDVTTPRCVLSIPANRTFTRLLSLPKLSSKDLKEAILSEISQYIPVQLEDLYTDYEILGAKGENIDVWAVAANRDIVDSYMELASILGLEVVALETTIGATSRLFNYTGQASVPTVIIDFSSNSSDITIYDKTIVVAGTVEGGGDDFTTIIANALNVSHEEAHVIKTKYGLNVSKKQRVIIDALTPTLQQIIKEIRRMIRYYEERSGSKEKIGQIITLGGGANIPGLSEYLIDSLRLPVRVCDPWERVSFGHLQPLKNVQRSMYVTVAGLALIQPKEIFNP